MKKIIFILYSITFCLLFIAISAFAKVSGPCSNCHTMHNSQNGSYMATDDAGNPSSTSFSGLTLNSCLGCHSSTNSAEDISVIGAPIVYNTGGPSYGFYDGTNYHGLAGGNFYWVMTDDEKGHNVFASNPEDTMDLSNGAPGSLVTCGGTNNCHDNIDGTVSGFFGQIYGPLNGMQGCTKCHMLNQDLTTSFHLPPLGYHHADDTGPVIDSHAEGWYRFLDGHNSAINLGVTGMEDPNWESNPSSAVHNEYLGNSIPKAQTSAGMGGANPHGPVMTGYCVGCHSNFHWQKLIPASTPWIRHPSDAVIPDTGEYTDAFGASGSGTGTYDPQVPVARDDLTGWTNPSGAVTLDVDMVMCLSCHRPHGSPYNDMLRWDYSEMIAGDSSKSGGCFTCHTEKNQTP